MFVWYMENMYHRDSTQKNKTNTKSKPVHITSKPELSTEDENLNSVKHNKKQKLSTVNKKLKERLFEEKFPIVKDIRDMCIKSNEIREIYNRYGLTWNVLLHGLKSCFFSLIVFLGNIALMTKGSEAILVSLIDFIRMIYYRHYMNFNNFDTHSGLYYNKNFAFCYEIICFLIILLLFSKKMKKWFCKNVTNCQ